MLTAALSSLSSVSDGTPARVFLLSPADVNGIRARHILRPGARSELALRYREGRLPIEDAFAYMSALYFRGKLAYARAFADSAGREIDAALVITAGFGLVPFGWTLDPDRVRKLKRVDVSSASRAYRRPLEQSSAGLASRLTHDSDEVVLLGSVATGKYLDVLLPIFGSRLRFPKAFVGTGDMRRGSMMLNAARDGEQLEYVDCSHARSTRPQAAKRLA